MSDVATPAAESDDDRFAQAIAQAASWARANGGMTGLWANRRHLSIGVGLPAGDEIETTEELRRLAPKGIRLRTRVASASLVKLWQLQADLENYLEDEGFWGTPVTSLGHDLAQRTIEVGLLPDASSTVVDQIRAAFLDRPITFAQRGSARALRLPPARACLTPQDGSLP